MDEFLRDGDRERAVGAGAKKMFLFFKNTVNISVARNAFLCDLCIECGLRCVNLVE